MVRSKALEIKTCNKKPECSSSGMFAVDEINGDINSKNQIGKGIIIWNHDLKRIFLICQNKC